MLRKTFSFLSALALACVCAGPVDAATIVYEHAPGGPGAWASEDTVAEGPIWRTFDQFTLSSTHVITGLTWQGGYIDFTETGDHLAPDSTAFTFRIYANVGGVPAAAPMFESTVPFANVTTSLVGGGFVGGVYPAEIYDFAVALPSGFMASGGVTYWLSIASVSAAYGPTAFGWTGGLGGNNSTYQLANLTTPTFRTGDRAFALLAVPEPTTLSMLGLGVATAIAARRRISR